MLLTYSIDLSFAGRESRRNLLLLILFELTSLWLLCKGPMKCSYSTAMVSELAQHKL